jgi:hypothetical protein
MTRLLGNKLQFVSSALVRDGGDHGRWHSFVHLSIVFQQIVGV